MWGKEPSQACVSKRRSFQYFVCEVSRIMLFTYILYVFPNGMTGYVQGTATSSENYSTFTNVGKADINQTHEDRQTTGSYQEHTFTPYAVSSLLTNYTDENVVSTCSEVSSNFQRIGDVNIGGLFSIHHVRYGICQDDIDLAGLQRMYAMVYMIDKINLDPDLLTNVTLGFDIRDYCGDVNIAVASSMDFIEASSSVASAADCSNTQVVTQSGVTAVIGPSHSDAALSVASLFNLFKLPEVSPLATSTELSDERYSYFLRTVPNDNTQIIALADIVQYFRWSSIGVLSTDDIAYGIKGSELLVNELQARNVCVAYQTRFNADYTDSDFQDIIGDLRKLSNIKVLVSIADEVSMLKLLDVFAQNELFGYTWLASEGWSWSPKLVEEKYYKVVQGMLGVSVPSYSDSAFTDYLKGLTVDCQDPFLTQYWEKTHTCYLTTRSKGSSVSACTGNESFASNDPFLIETLVSSVMDAVKVVAYGLQECNVSTEPKDLLDCMKGVDFVNDEKYRIFFKDNGDLASYARYDITNIQPSSDCRSIFPPKLIGTWIENIGLDINESTIFWPAPDGNCSKNWKETHDFITPESFCSADCDFGYRQQTDPENNCCWECIDCPIGEYSNTTNALKCFKCNYDEMTNSSKNGCEKLPYYYLTPKTNSVALITCIVTLVGFVGSFCLLLFFVVKRNFTVVYFACGKLFKFPLLASIICCFSFAAFSFAPTTHSTCRVSAIIQLLPIILCQMNLLFMCVFHKFNSKNAKQYNAWIFLIIMSSYCCLMAIGYMINNPSLSKDPDTVNLVLSIGCSFKGAINCYRLAILYVLVMDVVGITFSYRIRTKEGNFNEAKFIFYTFISRVMLWITMILVSVVVGNDTHSKQLTIAFGMLCSAYVTLACIYVPKLHAYKRKTEARTIVKHTKAKRGWKVRRRRNDLNDSQIWNEEATMTKHTIIQNLNKTINAINGEMLQTNRMVSICNDHQRELRKRYSNSESELLNKLDILRNAKVQFILSSKYLKSTRC